MHRRARQLVILRGWRRPLQVAHRLMRFVLFFGSILVTLSVESRAARIFFGLLGCYAFTVLARVIIGLRCRFLERSLDKRSRDLENKP